MATSLRIKLLLTALFSLLFVSLQGMAAAHEAQFGKSLHDHDGQVCTVHLLGDRDDDLLSPATSCEHAPLYMANATEPLSQTIIVRAATRTDHARAPPSSK